MLTTYRRTAGVYGYTASYKGVTSKTMFETIDLEPGFCANTNHPRRAGPVSQEGTNTSQSQAHTSLHSDNGTGCYRPARRSPVDKLERKRGKEKKKETWGKSIDTLVVKV